MTWFDHVDWRSVLLPDTPVVEIVVRGTIVYLTLFFLLRLVLKRESGTLGVTDLLVIVLIADAAQNAMAGGYQSVPDGLLLVGVIVGWSFVLDWLAYHSRFFERLVRPRRLPLIQNGKLVLENMRKELVTREELRSQLRKQSIDDLSTVRAAYMEPDGRISVLTKDNDHRPSPDEDGRAM